MSNGVDKQLDESQKLSAPREWNEAGFANLLNVKDDSVNDENEVEQEQEQPTEHQTSYINKNVVTQGELFDDPHSGKTQPTLASNPFAKFGTVGLGFGVVFVIAASVASKIMTAPRIAPPMANTTPSAKPEIVVEEKQEVETGKYKAELALDEQVKTIKAFEIQAKNKAKKQTTKQVTPSSDPVKVSHTKESRPPRELYRYQQATISQPQPTVNPPPPPPPRPRPIPTPSIDPMQQWLAAANVGNVNLGDNQSDNNSIDKTSVTSSVTSADLPTGGIGLDNQTNTADYNGNQILVGSRADGVMETPIAWTLKDGVYEQKYLIKLTQAIKASDGSVIVPTNSYIVAKMIAAQGEFVQLTAVSAVVKDLAVNGEDSNKMIEKPIPENTILVLGKEGKALRGKTKKGSTLASVLSASLLSGISKAAEVVNNSDSQINVQGSTTIVNNSSNHNIAAGLISGSTQELVQRIRTSNQQRLQEIQSEPKVYLIEQGTPVQIFVNESISL